MNKLKTLFLSIIIALAVAAIAFAWTNPPGTPPSGGGALYFSNGNVGIGTTSPGYKLDVSGSFRATGDWSLGGSAQTDLAMNSKNITGVNKLTVATIDPVYEIKDKKYASYAASIVGGVKEEYVGRAELKKKEKLVDSAAYEYVIDFSKLDEGSDLWVWRRVVDFSRDNVEVFATPYKVAAPIAYEIDGEKIIFRTKVLSSLFGELPEKIEISYRLVGKRFDWQNWSTLVKDQTEKANLIIK